jgi:Transposase DDE domain
MRRWSAIRAVTGCPSPTDDRRPSRSRPSTEAASRRPRPANRVLEIEQGAGDDAAGAGEPTRAGFRTWGTSKDHREDLPQIVIGMAVTRSGIPVRVWCWPGTTADSTLIRQVTDDLRDWTLARVVWVADRGFASAENRRYLQRAGGHYILGERLRSGSTEAAAALARPGRYRQVAENLQVTEVRLADDVAGGDRFVVCFHREAAERDRQVRERLLAQLGEVITGSDRLSATKRAELQRLHMGSFTGPAGTFRQRTELTAEQKAILAALGQPDPPRVLTATPAA